jgi:lysozyme family protein
MKENYDAALKATLRYEGGKVDDPRDPGGRTAYGVTQNTYNAWRAKHGLNQKDVFQIADSEVAAIYKQEYWDKIRGDDLPDGVDFAVFDFAVNSGVSRAAKYLQSMVGVTQDGVIGPKTIAAAKTYLGNRLTDMRLGFLKGLPTWNTFGRGWSNRINDVYAVVRDLCSR